MILTIMEMNCQSITRCIAAEISVLNDDHTQLVSHLKTSYSFYARLTTTNQNKKTVKTIFAVFYFGSFNQSFDS